MRHARFLFLIVSMWSIGVPAVAAPSYSIVELGTLPGLESCGCFSPVGLNESGAVVGTYFDAQGLRRGFIWENGVMRDMGFPAATGNASAVTPQAINSAGTAVGFGAALAFAAQGGVVNNLASLGGPFGVARDINNAGAIVGQASLPNQFAHAALWPPNSAVPVDLGTLGGALSEAVGINLHGHVVGASLNAQNQQRAFLWTPTTGMNELASPPTTIDALAVDINAAGQVIGHVRLAAGQSSSVVLNHAFIWIQGVPTDLGDLGDSPMLAVVPSGLNDMGQVVGAIQSEGFDTMRAFLWEAGIMRDLNSLLTTPSPLNVIVASDINNAGEIAAVATGPDGLQRAVLLQPAAPPCAVDLDSEGVFPGGTPDGAVDINDLLYFLVAFEAGNGAVDLDDDGDPARGTPDGGTDVSDLLFFLARFEAGC